MAPCPSSADHAPAPQLATPQPTRLTHWHAQRQLRIETRHRATDDRLGEHADLLCSETGWNATGTAVQPSWFDTVMMLAAEEIADERLHLRRFLGDTAAVFAIAAHGTRPLRGLFTPWRLQAGALRSPGDVPARTLVDPWLHAVHPRLFAPLPRLHRELFLTLAPAFDGTANALLRAVHAAILDR